MSNGSLSFSGQSFILDSIAEKINGLGGLYVGLMTNNVPLLRTDQTPSGIVELSSTTCSGYARVLTNSFTAVYDSDAPYIKGSSVTFTIASGSWNNVYGYFVSKDLNNTILWSEVLPSDKCGLIPSGNPIIITPLYYQY